MRAELAATQDQLVAVLSRVTRDSALGGHARLAHRMTATIRAAFAAAQRVVDRVHRLGAGVRAIAHVPLASGLADAHVDVIEVAELSDGRAALALHAAHFTAG